MTGCAGVVAVAELVDLLGVVGHLDAGDRTDQDPGEGERRAVAGGTRTGPVGRGGLPERAGHPPAGCRGDAVGCGAGAGIDHRRGLARRFTPEHVAAIESGWGKVIASAFDRLPETRRAQLLGGPVTIDLNSTDVEVHGSGKHQVGLDACHRAGGAPARRVLGRDRPGSGRGRALRRAGRASARRGPAGPGGGQPARRRARG